jgi:DNA-binding transcriptional LysR family regulator
MRTDDVNGVDIELRDLRLALVTSRHRSLRQAAEALNIRQSTLSRRLHEIERQLGVVLFERTNGGARLTTVGLEFVASAKRILDDVDTELQRLRSRSRGELGLLAISGKERASSSCRAPSVWMVARGALPRQIDIRADAECCRSRPTRGSSLCAETAAYQPARHASLNQTSS